MDEETEKKLHKLIKARVEEEVGKKKEELDRKNDEFLKRMKRLTNYDKNLQTRREGLDAKEKELAEKENQIAAREAGIGTKEAELLKLEAGLTEQDMELSEQEAVLDWREKGLYEWEAELKKRGQEIPEGYDAIKKALGRKSFWFEPKELGLPSEPLAASDRLNSYGLKGSQDYLIITMGEGKDRYVDQVLPLSPKALMKFLEIIG